ncbi:hypothetical protein AB0O76_03560 [Streptomyces sp. NPDC086554]|uniref:hypothetical protein n=1 Tax=Streptomyces sp. NPDC086554 TaxID=3154864 RepID=UPI00341B1034
MYPGQQGQPYPPQPYPPQQGQPYPPQQQYQQHPPQQQYPQQQYQQFPPQQQYQQHPPQQGQQAVGDGMMAPAPGLSPEQRDLVLRIQNTTKVFVLGLFVGIPLTFGGAHFGITEKPLGFAAVPVGIVGFVVGVISFLKMNAMKRQLRSITADAWRSPVAHLQSARKAATLAAYLNGLLALLSLAVAVYLLIAGAGWGAYGNSFGFGGLMLAAAIPLGQALAAASTIPQLLRVIPAGARVGQSLYSVLLLLGIIVTFRGSGWDTKAIAAVFTLICLGAVTLLAKAGRTMRGESG